MLNLMNTLRCSPSLTSTSPDTVFKTVSCGGWGRPTLERPTDRAWGPVPTPADSDPMSAGLRRPASQASACLSSGHSQPLDCDDPSSRPAHIVILVGVPMFAPNSNGPEKHRPLIAVQLVILVGIKQTAQRFPAPTAAMRHADNAARPSWPLPS